MKTKSMSLLLVVVILGHTICLGIADERSASEMLMDAQEKYFEEKSKNEARFRKALAASIEFGDRVEVYLLDFEFVDTPSDFGYWETRLEEGEFPIIPKGAKSEILQTVELTVDQRKEFLPVLKEAIGVDDDGKGGALCHYPIHGVRVFEDGVILFQSSFCWYCRNFCVSYPDGARWVQLSPKVLLPEFEKYVPIPKGEIERFNAQHRPGKKETDEEAEQ